MNLWQRLCTYGLTLLEGSGLFDQTTVETPVGLLKDLNHIHNAKPVLPFMFNRTNIGYVSNNECNSPIDRKQWCYNQNINTDYEDIALVPVTGVMRNITLVITSNNTFCGDGYCRETMLINGQYPGPAIRGNWGDWFNITVHNHLSNGNGTSIHWHGLRQFRTVWADGVPGVTQCPIPPGESMSYIWRATQYGTSWYHSHFSLQYADGIAGPLIIDGPSTTEYDEDKGPLMLTDWYHASAFSIYYVETTPGGSGPPTPQSKLINGIGNFTTNGTADGSLAVFACKPEEDDNCQPWRAGMYGTYVEYGKKYKLRLINTSATTHFSFWIEGHDFTIIATDFVPIEPYQVSYVNVAIGQRYEIILEAKEKRSMKEKYKGKNFWIKMRSCDNVCIGEPCKTTGPDGLPSCTFEECRQGIISYDLTSSDSPDLNWKKAVPPVDRCSDPPRDKIKPWVRRDLRGHVSPNLRFLSPFEVENRPGTQTPPGTVNYTDVNLWNIKFNDGISSFMIDWERPTMKLVNDAQPLDPRYVPIEIDGQNSEWTVFAIVSNWKTHDGSPKPEHAIPGAAHPIHLHGHDFVVLSQVQNATRRNATFDLNHTLSLDLFNPPRRDVVMLPSDGYVVIAFRVDNPGTWLMHCHIAWHASAGLALQWIERRDDIPKLLKGPKAKGVMNQLDKQCEKWKSYYENSKEKQDDSGI